MIHVTLSGLKQGDGFFPPDVHCGVWAIKKTFFFFFTRDLFQGWAAKLHFPDLDAKNCLSPDEWFDEK